jgi:hypothetical protein
LSGFDVKDARNLARLLAGDAELRRIPLILDEIEAKFLLSLREMEAAAHDMRRRLVRQCEKGNRSMRMRFHTDNGAPCSKRSGTNYGYTVDDSVSFVGAWCIMCGTDSEIGSTGQSAPRQVSKFFA